RLVDVQFVQPDVAGHPAVTNGVVHPVETAQEGRLAATRRADQRGDRSRGNIEADALQRLLGAVIDVDIACRHLDFDPGISEIGSSQCSLHDRSLGGSYQRRSKRLRRKMAVRFISSRKTSRTTMAPEVFSTKPRSGLSAHMKICTGSTVAASTGVAGMSTMKATMPITSSGAVSPSACAMAMIVPVRTPGMARGST